MTKEREMPELKSAQEALAHELINAGFEEAADYIMGDYMRAVMAEKLCRPLPPSDNAGEVKITGETSDGYHTFNELYEHRHILFLAVLTANIDKAWRSKLHADGTMFDDWFIAGLDTDLGQATYHLPMRIWELFKYIPELDRAPEWDGHTSNDVLVRIRDMAFFNGVKAATPPPATPDGVDVESIKWQVTELPSVYKIDSVPRGEEYADRIRVIDYLHKSGHLRTPAPLEEVQRAEALEEDVETVRSEIYLKDPAAMAALDRIEAALTNAKKGG